MYTQDELLALSGIQHFCFCPRQWALIALEQQWQENLLTVEGRLMHERAHDDSIVQRIADGFVSRGVQVHSSTLGVFGVCDVVEFHEAEDGIELAGRKGRYLPVPVEYKRGKSKEIDADRLQLCCQAMCLEEMLCCDIAQADIFYGQPHRREHVPLTPSLREEVRSMLSQMHAYWARGYTPMPKRTKGCNACSLAELCLPALSKKQDARAYLLAKLEEE